MQSELDYLFVSFWKAFVVYNHQLITFKLRLQIFQKYFFIYISYQQKLDKQIVQRAASLHKICTSCISFNNLFYFKNKATIYLNSYKTAKKCCKKIHIGFIKYSNAFRSILSVSILISGVLCTSRI